jgi:hypothetical protein
MLNGLIHLTSHIYISNSSKKVLPNKRKISKIARMKIRFRAFLFLIPLLFSGCITSPHQRAAHEGQIERLESEARNGVILTESEWSDLIGNKWNGRTVQWLNGLIGAPDQFIAGHYKTFLIYHDRCLDIYTQKPTDLCVCATGEVLDGNLFDAKRIKYRR